MTPSQQIEQLSREDPNYGAIVKSIQQGQAARAMIKHGGDPFTTYAVMHLAGIISDYIHGGDRRKTMQTATNLGQTALKHQPIEGLLERALNG